MAVPMKLPVLVALVIILCTGNARTCTGARLLSETPVPVPPAINETSIKNLPPADLLNSADLSALAGGNMNVTDLAALFAGSQPNITELSAIYGTNVTELTALAGAGQLNVTDLSALAASLPNNTGSSPSDAASPPGAAGLPSSVAVALPNITLPDLSMGSMDLPEFSFPPISAPGEIVPMSNFTIFGHQVSLPSFLDISTYFNNDKS